MIKKNNQILLVLIQILNRRQTFCTIFIYTMWNIYNFFRIYNSFILKNTSLMMTVHSIQPKVQ